MYANFTVRYLREHRYLFLHRMKFHFPELSLVLGLRRITKDDFSYREQDIFFGEKAFVSARAKKFSKFYFVLDDLIVVRSSLFHLPLCCG